MTYEVEREPDRSTYAFRLDTLDDLRQRVSDLYAVGATGGEKVWIDGYQLKTSIASHDLWPRVPHRRHPITRSRVLVGVQWLVILILLIIII